MDSQVNPARSKVKQSSVVRTLRMGKPQDLNREVETRWMTIIRLMAETEFGLWSNLIFFMIEPEWIFKTVDEDCVNQVAETFKLPLTIDRKSTRLNSSH